MPQREENILAVLAAADAIDLAEGKRAYGNYHALLKRLAEHYHIPFKTVVAVFAATSPNNDYFKNLRSTASLCSGYKAGLALEHITVSTYRACAVRAWRCLRGENFLDFTEGLKTRSFYHNILEPKNPDYVTVDGHMLSIWYGQRMTMQKATRFHKYYEAISNSVKDVAQEAGLVPNQVQAICWFTWKRIHKPVRGDGQLSLLNTDDHWRTVLEPEDVPVFIHKSREPIAQLELNLSSQLSLWPM